MFSFKMPPFPVVLAPMAGVTDLPFRVICRENGADYTVSEMVSAKALLYKNQKTFAMLTIDPKEHPTAILVPFRRNLPPQERLLNHAAPI